MSMINIVAFRSVGLLKANDILTQLVLDVN